MKIKNIRIRAENKDNIPSSILELGVIENPCVHTPIAIIDKRIIWYGIPSTIENLESNNDSLKTQYRPVIRFEGQCTASSVIGFLKWTTTPITVKASPKIPKEKPSSIHFLVISWSTSNVTDVANL